VRDDGGPESSSAWPHRGRGAEGGAAQCAAVVADVAAVLRST
jgi:hypothetical protein